MPRGASPPSLSGMNENAIHNGAVDEYSPFRFALSIFASSRLLASCLPNKSPSNSDHVIIIFSRFVTTICMRGYTRLDRLPLGWMEFPQRCDVSAVGPRLGNSWAMSVVNRLVNPWIFSSRCDAWLGLILRSYLHHFAGPFLSISRESVALSLQKGQSKRPQTKPFMSVLASAPARPKATHIAHFSLA